MPSSVIFDNFSSISDFKYVSLSLYLSAGKDAQNNGYIVRIITDKGNTEIKDVETIYAIGAKKEAVAHNRQGYGENTPFAFTASSISISDLLNIVKNNYSDILSNSVLEHFGIERGKSAVSGDVVYSFANQPAVDGNTVSEATHAENLKNNEKGSNTETKQNKENLSQVNPQLNEMLAIINDKSSFDNSIHDDTQNVNSSAEETSQQNTGVSYPLANLPAHTITEDTDTRTGETIYTLKFNEHLTPEQFNSARDEIKQNGGYYSRFKKGFIFKDDTLYKAYNEVYNKGTNTADNKTADSAEIGVQSNDTGRNVKETAAGLLQGVSGSGEPSDTGAVRGVRESSGDGGGNGEVSGHTQRQTGESVLSEHDAGTARSVHGHSEHVIKQVAAFIKKYAAKRNYAKKNYAPTTEMGAREFIEQETKNGYTLIDEGGAIISYLKSDGKNLSDEVKNWVNRLGKLGITVNVSDGKLKRFIEGYCAEFDGFFHKKLNEIFLSADILKEDIDAKNHELFHYIFHNYPEIADRFVNTLFSNLSDKFDPLIQSELEWIFDGYADGDIYSENNLLKLTDEITAYFITYLNFGHKNSNLFNSIINDRATVEEAFNQMLDELERARSKTDGDADLSRTQENISKGENSDVQQGVLGRQDSDNDSVRESESVQKVEKDGDTGKENRNADGISGNENGVDVRDTQEISSSAGSESGGTVDDGVRKSDVRNGNDGTGHNGTDNVDVNTEYNHLIEKADVGSQVPNADNSLQPTSKTPLVSSSASDSSVTQNSDFVNDEKENVSDSDETILKAMEVAVESGSLSTALLQRKLQLGYSETAKIMDRLEELGVIGAYEGSKPRKVLISYDEYLAMREKLKAENGTDSTDGDISYSFNGRNNSTDKENAEITESDVITLRSIGRKSVNDFTAEDIKKAEPFARKYYAEMGAKSPFLRAWFGDWRARDNTKVSIANVKGNERGKVKNTDTGWEIQVSSKVFNETKSHNSTRATGAITYLDYINDIVKKAVLLDSYIIPEGKTKSVNSAMMHSLYAIADMGNGNELIKLYVEEQNDINNDGTIKRAYQLQNIVKAPAASVRVQNNIPSSLTSTASTDTYTVSQLFDLVKSYDKNFKPGNASKVVNDDGTPKVVYHGTNSDFSVFDITKSRSYDETSDYDLPGFYFSENSEEAGSYGNYGEYYLDLKNPYNGDIYSLAKEKGSYRKAYDYLVSQGYDGMIVDDMGEGFTEYIVFHPNQIKSVTGNSGTFNAEDSDIYFSFNGRNNSTDEENKYSYNRLTALDDMSVTRIVSSIPKKEDGKIDREAIISSGLNNAFKVGRRVNSDTAVVKNKYSGEEIAISKRGLKHSLDRRSAVALATLNIGEIVQNALRVNEMSPRNEHVAVSYPMVGYASDANGNKYAVLLVVNRNNDSYPTIDGVSVYETLYSHNAKKTESGVHSTRSYDDNSPLFPNSTISIAELMNVVKDQFPNVLSDDVLSHYGTSKTESNYDGILYSFNGRNSGETEQAGQSEQTDKGKYIPKGEKPFRDVNIPKEDAYGGKVSYGIRTYAEAESTPDERIATVLDDVKRGKYSHKVISDESALINAENLINTKGYAEAMQSILERVDYEKYTERGYCPIYAREQLTRVYEAYHGMGGNGTGTDFYKKTIALPPEPQGKAQK